MNGRLLPEMPRRDPVSGTFELTLRCNLKCRMCLFRHEDSEFPQMAREELSTAEWIDMARQAAEAGTFSLLVTGGEPMFRKDFCEIWEGIYQYGFMTELYTNATLVTDAVMETLRRCPPHKIGVTLYGASAETYEKVCGNGAMFERAVAGSRRLCTLPSVIEFRATVIRQNYADAELLEEFVEKEFGIKGALTTARLVNKGVRGACARAEDCRLTPEENVKLNFLRARMRLKKQLGDAYDENNVYVTRPDEPGCEKHGEPKLTLLGCEGGMSRYVITYDGKLLGCQMLDLYSTDAAGEGLREAWERFPTVVKLPERNEKCLTCGDARHCIICPAVAYAETGGPDGWPEYICRDTAAMNALISKV